ncbi:WD40 repeat domain-containing protein [Sporosarcina sp. P33]|uniref:WD40 repeat domain-containing protein n=1 Tax=Sporosarcina sp. P33 TaxID=1930764 RepID=UPI0009BF4F5D|nr:Ig-like domain-containing protein [Sporosarcina sp. P33]ARD48855.1 hypothetical protein SporoP33_11880 [Sporosarcina sp. P33]
MKRVMQFAFAVCILYILQTGVATAETAETYKYTIPEILKFDTEAIVIASDFSRDGKYIVTSQYDDVTTRRSSVKVWEAATGSLIGEWSFPGMFSKLIDEVRYNPNGKQIAVLTENISIINVSTGKVAKTLKVTEPYSPFPTDIVFNKEGTVLYASYTDGTVAFWDTDSWEKIKQFKMPQEVISLAYIDNFRQLAIATKNGDIHIRDAETGAYAKTLTGIYLGEGSISYSSESNIVIGASKKSNQPFLLNASENYRLMDLKPSDFNTIRSWGNDIDFSPDGKYVALFTRGDLEVFDTITKEKVSQVRQPEFLVRGVRFSEATNRIAAGNRVYDTASLPVREFEKIQIEVTSTNMEPGQKQAAEVIGMYSDSTAERIKPSEIKWQSTEPSVADFLYGKLEAIRSGKANIIAEYRGLRASIEIQVESYREIEEKLNISQNKVWDVNFNQEVDIQTIKEKNIYITNDQNEIIPILYYVRSNKSSTVQLIPVKDYEAGKRYTLWIRELQSASGMPLQQVTKMNFVIAD